MPSRPLLSKRQNGSDSGASAPLEGVMQILAQSARRRIGVFATVFSGAFGIGFVLSLFLPHLLDQPSENDWIYRVLTGFLTATSICLAAVARSNQISPGRLVTIGLVYVVLGCLSMSGAEVLLGPPDSTARAGISGICVWLVMFPLIIPSAPLKALVTALLGASMLPMSYSIGIMLGNQPLSITALVDWFLPLYFCAGLAYAAARSVYSWGNTLAQNERKMAELGSYKLTEEIASGGMGIVYRAQHRFLPRDAAVKLIDTQRLNTASHPESGSMLAALFEREARSIAMLESPHTVAVYDYGISDRGELYLAMEMLRGTDLQKVVSTTGPMPAERVVMILLQVCDSLAEAHSKGLIHRDIKPANIFIGKVAMDYDFVKVLDFGLANLVSAAQSEHQGGAIIGTPGYIAPEALTGGNIDTGVDLYALGCVAFFLLTGRTVFGENGNENLVAHIRKVPPDLTTLVPNIDPLLATIIAQCLAKKPDQRPANATALRRDLMRCMSAGQWNSSSAQTWWSEHRQCLEGSGADTSTVKLENAHVETLETYNT